jgi:hypothetical protein
MARRPLLRLWLVLALVWTAGACSRPPPSWLSVGSAIADGVEYFESRDPSLVNPPAPIAVYLLRLDPDRVRLASVHANDQVMGLEAVDSLARRHGAIAAINGGFFNTRNGDPQFVLKEAGELVSDTRAVKGAVIVRSPPRGRTEIAFDQISARVALKFHAADRDWVVPVAGLNTTRARGRLMLYTPRYHSDTDTAANGTEWILSGDPLRVTEVRRDAGHTPIPPDGRVLSYGGLDLPEALQALVPGVEVEFETTWRTLNGTSPERLEEADHIVSGAGLLRLNGRALDNWENTEALSPQRFLDMRHPRTVVGVDADGYIWFAAIDGRQPDYSVGMTFADLQTLCDRLQLTGALNLDGGGSTTMVAQGLVVNRPSDVGGPRRVSDAILVQGR